MKQEKPSKMKWFKHYNNASQSDLIRHFIAEQDFECVGLFWYLLEYLSRNDDQERSGNGVIKITFLAKEMGMKPSKIRRVLVRFSSVPQSWYGVCTDEEFSFRVPKWSELQKTRGSYDRHKNGIKSVEERDKEIKSKEVRGEPLIPPTGFLVIFLEQYEKQYLRKAAVTINVKKQADQIGKVLPEAEWQETIKNFLSDDRTYYEKQGHQLHCLLKDLEAHRPKLAKPKDDQRWM